MEFYPSNSNSRITHTQHQLDPNLPSPPSPPTLSSSSSPNWRPLSEVDFEPMFEKVVTPSDVGKLNRLVIPKQHAERFFPLDPTATTTTTTASSTMSTTVGGLLLSFEERRSGKPWRFRYSYWNSSQSYVMTKGWSRFVKEKHLSPGDTVSFSRCVTDMHRLFIGWRRRPAPPQPSDHTPIMGSVVPSWAGGGMLQYFPPLPPPPLHDTGMYFRSMGPMPQFQVRMVDRGTILESVPVVSHGPTNMVIEGPRRRHCVRLFGVDLDDDDQDVHRRMNTELQLMPPQSMEEEGR